MKERVGGRKEKRDDQHVANRIDDKRNYLLLLLLQQPLSCFGLFMLELLEECALRNKPCVGVEYVSLLGFEQVIGAIARNGLPSPSSQ